MDTPNIWDSLIYIEKRRDVPEQVRTVLHTDGVLYPISESDTKDYWIYGIGRTKLKKNQIQYVPRYDGEVDKFIDYLNTYGSKVTYFCLTGKEWHPQELCEGRSMGEFMQLEAFGLRYLEYVKDWKLLDQLVVGLLHSYDLKDFWFTHYYDKISLRPSFSIMSILPVPAYMDALHHDEKLVTTYKIVEYLKREKTSPSINIPISKKTDEEFEQDRLVDQYNQKLQEDIEKECAENIDARFPICMQERVRWFYGDKGVDLYTKLMDMKNYQTKAS